MPAHPQPGALGIIQIVPLVAIVGALRWLERLFARRMLSGDRLAAA